MKFYITTNRQFLSWFFACILGMAWGAQAQIILFQDDFSSGDLSNWSSKTTASASQGVAIVDGSTSPANPFTGYGARFYDLNTGNTATLQRNYTTSATLQLFQFDAAIAAGAASTSSSSETYFRVMNSGQNPTSTTNSPFTITFRMDGTVAVSSGSISISTTGIHLSIYTNTGSSTTITSVYGDSLSLGANQYAVYNGTTLLGVYSFSSVANFTASSGIQAFGFYSTSSNTGSDFVFDNFSVTDVLAVPEAPSYAFFLLGILGCLAFYKRKCAAAF